MQPAYFCAPSGRLFLAVYGGDRTPPPNHWVIHFPAFAEEMNKSRPMVSRMARSFAAQGSVVIVPDLSGTGDSEGEFGSADWNQWISDMAAVIGLARSQGAQSFTFWGLRLGCLLAAELLSSLGQEVQGSVRQLIFWQPVVSGSQYMTQFLRLRVAASMMSGPQTTVAELRARSAVGEVLEVAGYTLSPDLISQLDGATLQHASLTPHCSINDDARCRWSDIELPDGTKAR